MTCISFGRISSHSLNFQIILVISLKDQKRRKNNLVSFSKENLKVKREIAEQETELNEWKTF